MESITRMAFVPHGIRCSVNNTECAAYTNSELRAQSLLGIGIAATNSAYTPHDAGNEIIELAARIKSERAIMAM